MYKALVSCPVTDLRREPIAAQSRYAVVDPMQETQLLYGEKVVVHQEKGSWARVEAVEQRRWRQETNWHGYPGWIERSAIHPVDHWPDAILVVAQPWIDVISNSGQSLPLSLGSCLAPIEREEDHWQVVLADETTATVAASDVTIPRPEWNPQRMVARAEPLLGHPYLWGGRSIHRSDWKVPATGIDCSSLVQLLYRLEGIPIARDAADQHRQCRPIPLTRLAVGDLVFLPDIDHPDRIGHVMLYCGDEMLLEASLTAGRVKRISFEEKIGLSLQQLCLGKRPKIQFIVCGTLFGNHTRGVEDG